VVLVNSLDAGDRLFSRKLACVDCGVSVPEMTPRAFSFNSPHGACPACQGLGALYDFDRSASSRRGPVAQRGAIEPWMRGDRAFVREALDRIHEVFGVISTRRSGACRRSTATC